MADLPPALPPTTRRGFLRLASAQASLAALARLRLAPGAGALTVPLEGVELEASPRFFDARATSILTAIVDRMVDTGEPDAPPLRATRAIATIDRLCLGLDPALTEPLPMALQLFEWGPYVFDWKLARFTNLSAAEQDASLDGWRTSRFATRRLAFYALRNLALFGYWSQDATWPLIGYAGPLLRRSGDT